MERPKLSIVNENIKNTLERNLQENSIIKSLDKFDVDELYKNGSQPQKKDFQKIIVKCVLHLLMINTVSEIFSPLSDTINEAPIINLVLLCNTSNCT